MLHWTRRRDWNIFSFLNIEISGKKPRKIEMFPPIPSMKEKTVPYLYERLSLYKNSLYRCIFMTKHVSLSFKDIRNNKSKQSHGFKVSSSICVPFFTPFAYFL